jgi:hypothetical protein
MLFQHRVIIQSKTILSHLHGALGIVIIAYCYPNFATLLLKKVPAARHFGSKK